MHGISDAILWKMAREFPLLQLIYFSHITMGSDGFQNSYGLKKIVTKETQW
jgi:hypothetical protein